MLASGFFNVHPPSLSFTMGACKETQFELCS